MKKALFALLLTGVIAITATLIGVASRGSSEDQALSGPGEAGYTLAQSSTGVSVATTNTLVLATSTSRTYARISNLSGNAMYCNMNNGKAAVAYEGIMVIASSTYVFSDAESNLYRGAVNCIAIGAAASTTVYAH